MSQAQTTNLNTTQSHEWISKDCYYYDKLNFNENKISCFKEYASAYSYHNIGNKFKFTIKIIKQQSTIGIGISSTRNTSLKFLCFPFIRFKSNTETNINMDLKSTNQQFKQNDQVSVIGDLSTKTIILEINNQVANVLSYKQIADANRKWSTYIYLQKQAQVQIMNNFTQIELMSTFMSESLFAWDYDLLYHIYHMIQLLQLCTENI